MQRRQGACPVRVRRHRDVPNGSPNRTNPGRRQPAWCFLSIMPQMGSHHNSTRVAAEGVVISSLGGTWCACANEGRDPDGQTYSFNLFQGHCPSVPATNYFPRTRLINRSIGPFKACISFAHEVNSGKAVGLSIGILVRVSLRAVDKQDKN